jgi:excisionase family DNA binding protein
MSHTQVANPTASSPAAIQPADPSGVLPVRQRLSVTVNVAAQFTGISRSRVYELLHDGTLTGKVVAGRRVVLVESLLRLVGEAPSAQREAAA